MLSEKDVVLCTLSGGHSFGEIALYGRAMRRTATVISSSYCDLDILLKSDFQTLVADFPDMEKKIHERATAFAIEFKNRGLSVVEIQELKSHGKKGLDVDDGTLNPNNGPKTLKHRKPTILTKMKTGLFGASVLKPRSLLSLSSKRGLSNRKGSFGLNKIMDVAPTDEMARSGKIEGIKARMNELVSESLSMTEHHAYDKVCSSNLCKG